jgi:riboflavin biosynthesis pyrimidine reductase
MPQSFTAPATAVQRLAACALGEPVASKIVELFPKPGAERPLDGTYMEQRIIELGTREEPFVYANFVSSMDGRIAVADRGTGESYLLDDLTSGNDWRLFQELQAQASCLVTHGGYLRALAEGQFEDILQIGTTMHSLDIGEWRRKRGLTRQPAVAVASSSLDFPLAASLAEYDQPVHIFTGEDTPADRIRAWEDRGYPVRIAGSGGTVEGGPLVKALGELGYERLYLLTGPQMLETALRDRVLSRLYLTITHQVLGGEVFHTLVSGPVLGDTGRLKLRSMYYDPEAPKGTGQWFCCFDVRGRG